MCHLSPVENESPLFGGRGGAGGRDAGQPTWLGLGLPRVTY